MPTVTPILPMSWSNSSTTVSTEPLTASSSILTSPPTITEIHSTVLVSISLPGTGSSIGTTFNATETTSINSTAVVTPSRTRTRTRTRTWSKTRTRTRSRTWTGAWNGTRTRTRTGLPGTRYEEPTSTETDEDDGMGGWMTIGAVHGEQTASILDLPTGWWDEEDGDDEEDGGGWWMTIAQAHSESEETIIDLPTPKPGFDPDRDCPWCVEHAEVSETLTGAPTATDIKPDILRTDTDLIQSHSTSIRMNNIPQSQIDPSRNSPTRIFTRPSVPLVNRPSARPLTRPTQPLTGGGRPVITVGSSTIPIRTVDVPRVESGATVTSRAFIIGSSTVSAGQTITINNTPVAVNVRPEATQIAVGGMTLPFFSPPRNGVSNVNNAGENAGENSVDNSGQNAGQNDDEDSGENDSEDASGNSGENANAHQSFHPITVSGQVLAETDSGGILIQGQTLTPGSVIAIDNNGAPLIISLDMSPDGVRELVFGGTSTITLPPTQTIPPNPLLSINGEIIAPNSQGRYIVDNQTLTPGGPPITVSGSVISLAPSATFVVVDGTTSKMILPTAAFVEAGEYVFTTTMPALLTMGDEVYTANSQGNFIIEGQTLRPGEVVTVDGTRVSLDSEATEVVVGTKAEELGVITTVVTVRGPRETGTKTKTGAAGKRYSVGWIRIWLGVVGASAILGLW
ncbi:hypothetical protein M501DRAFT_1012386 [Patellaria atrata CBS 101060]|uniref:Uncharacterized protein n=1 Tax=Patellaria atrata CBS 101060 TaxID=1346257 RepID=A0A9P4SHY5_9PEZI|nr:hypothetical protein M501DRAFT_1012386 [Patellaria atrata CBS 101060]